MESQIHPCLTDGPIQRALMGSLILNLFIVSSISPCLGRNMTLQPMTIIPSDYVKEYRPQPEEGNKPVLVNISIFIHDVSTISAVNMDFRLDMYLIQSWVDKRLDVSVDMLEDGEEFLVLSSAFLDKIWQPLLYISNAKSSQIMSLTRDFSSVTVFSNHSIKYNVRMSVTLGCQMEFRQFPVDIQECSMTLETFSYDSSKVKLQWADADEPVILNPTVKLLQFHLGTPIATESNVLSSGTRAGEYSQLKAYFKFERHLGYFLIQVFFPSFLIVVLSWFSFYMGLDAVPGRCTILITTFLALITMFSAMKGDLPPVSYIKALDIWMAVCMLFLFGATSEFVFVKYLDSLNKMKQVSPVPTISERIASLNAKLPSPPVGVTILNNPHQYAWGNSGRHPSKGGPKPPPYAQLLEDHHQKIKYRPPSPKKKNRIKEIENISKFGFPLAFAVFAIIYWPLLLFRKF